MRKAEFEVPSPLMSDFIKKLLKTELEYEISGVNKRDEIVLEVKYARDEFEIINELESHLEELIEEYTDDDDEDEDDED